MTKPGVEKFLANLHKYVGTKRIGLITNPSAVDSRLRSTLDLLTRTNQVSALFGLEHGVRGHVQAGEKVETTTDPQTNLPVFSLYGETRRPSPEMLADVECLVFDLQDVGCRFYTYLYSLLYLLEASASYQLPLIVLDRPNPLGGQTVSGNILEEKYISFVGYPLPIRYGLTIGEIALYFNQTRNINAPLTVVTMDNWERHYLWEQTGLSWIAPSPNIPTAQTALFYPGTCLIEGTNLSEGRGTTQPFELIGAPWIEPQSLVAKLNDLNLGGVIFRPTYFTPTFSKHQGELCGGVQLHLTSAVDFDPHLTIIKFLQTVIEEYPEFEFLTPPGERYFFDLLAGTNQLRELLTTRDSEGVVQLLKDWNLEAAGFAGIRQEFFLY